MSAPARRGRVYKDTTFQQLRSFYEAARLGSLSAAAAALGLAQPTVSQQIHALERQFGEPLLEPFGRGSRLTEAGRLLADLAGPTVLNMVSLKRRYEEARGQLEQRLIIAATPRTMIEDLLECLQSFTPGHPRVRVTLRETWRDQVPAVVQAGEVDMGFMGQWSSRGNEPTAAYPWLEFQPWYRLDTMLLTPIDHPLARRRVVRPRDLLGYPLINGSEGMPDLPIRDLFAQVGMFLQAPCGVEAALASSIVRLVTLGFGVGLVGALPGKPAPAGLHARNMTRHFGQQNICLVWRKHYPLSDAAQAFAAVVKTQLNPTRKASGMSR
ncbi:MAG TPA: LysR family transcriptional regulator [Gemmataceae bacterium]|nr:LysR family transcriptional regulator [Gemmataceae bacterium]